MVFWCAYTYVTTCLAVCYSSMHRHMLKCAWLLVILVFAHICYRMPGCMLFWYIAHMLPRCLAVYHSGVRAYMLLHSWLSSTILMCVHMCNHVPGFMLFRCAYAYVTPVPGCMLFSRPVAISRFGCARANVFTLPSSEE